MRRGPSIHPHCGQARTRYNNIAKTRFYSIPITMIRERVGAVGRAGRGRYTAALREEQGANGANAGRRQRAAPQRVVGKVRIHVLLKSCGPLAPTLLGGTWRGAGGTSRSAFRDRLVLLRGLPPPPPQKQICNQLRSAVRQEPCISGSVRLHFLTPYFHYKCTLHAPEMHHECTRKKNFASQK